MFVCLMVLFAVQVQAAKRTLTLLEVKRGPGINSENIDLFQAKTDSLLRVQDLFDVRPKSAIIALVDKLGGCKKEDCYNNSAKEVGINLVLSVGLFKQRTEYVATLYLFDTEIGEQVMEYSEKLPGELERVSDAWVLKFLSQLEPLAQAAEEVITKETDEAEAAQKATVIMDDELSGKLTKDKSPYLLVRNVVIPANATLEIDPGVTLLVGGDYVSIVVYGQLMVNGTAEAPVIIKSAKKEAKQWDWDRIYIRGNTRSYFNYCTISNSNFGVCVDNGNATLTECKFIKNSISCIYAYMSEVSLSNVEIGSGHITGIHVDEGSRVVADSGFIRNNNRAVVCQPYSKLEMTRTRIENNENGLVVDARASVELKDIRVFDNRVGVLSPVEIKAGKLFMIRGNDENLRRLDKAEAEKLFSRPEKIAAVRVKEKAFEDTAGFKAGFASVPSRGESFAARMGLLGQVSLGMTYRSITDHNATIHDSLAKASPKDLPHQATYVPGLRPEIQLYLQSKIGDRSSDFTLNAFGNYNTNRIQSPSGEANLANLDAYRNLQKIEVINLTTTIPGHEFVLGDFTQNQSELSISSRQIRGLKWQGNLTLQNHKKLKTEALVGQSTLPYAKGLKPDMLDSNNTAVRQEWLGMGSVKTMAGPDLELTAHAIYTRQVNDPVLLAGIDLTPQDLYGSDPKLASTSGGLSARMSFNQDYSAYAEIGAGYADTLSIDVDSSAASGIAAPYSKDTTIHHGFGSDNIAALAGLDYTIHGFSGNLEYLRAQNQFYSGGNPSIKPVVGNLQKAKWSIGRTFEGNWLSGKMRSIDLSAGFDWEAVGSSETGVKVDTVGTDKIILAATNSDSRKNEYNTYQNPDFIYQPNENKFKASLGIKLPVAEFSFEPDFSYYYETKPLLKRDSKSTQINIMVNGEESPVLATEYDDAESRLQIATVLVYSPAFTSPKISNMRYKIEYERIFIDDQNDFDVDSSKWSKNDGYQQRVKGSLAAKFLKKRLANKLDLGYRYKEKKERDEKKATINVLDKFTVDVIPRKVMLSLQGFYTTTTTDYVETETLEAKSELQKIYGGEAECKWGITSLWSLSAKGGYESALDNSGSGSENYETFYGGLTVNYLF